MFFQVNKSLKALDLYYSGVGAKSCGYLSEALLVWLFVPIIDLLVVIFSNIAFLSDKYNTCLNYTLQERNR